MNAVAHVVLWGVTWIIKDRLRGVSWEVTFTAPAKEMIFRGVSADGVKLWEDKHLPAPSEKVNLGGSGG